MLVSDKVLYGIIKGCAKGRFAYYRNVNLILTFRIFLRVCMLETANSIMKRVLILFLFLLYVHAKLSCNTAALS
jgi:hypothetical protein